LRLSTSDFRRLQLLIIGFFWIQTENWFSTLPRSALLPPFRTETVLSPSRPGLRLRTNTIQPIIASGRQGGAPRLFAENQIQFFFMTRIQLARRFVMWTASGP